MAEIRSYLPTLRINDSEVPLSGFSFQANANDLGTRADVSIPDLSAVIARGDQFDLTLRLNFGDLPKSRLIKDGKVAGSTKSWGAARLAGLTVADDKISIVGIDNISYRWKLAPRIPQVFFDPQYLTLDENDTETNVIDEDGVKIEAAITQVGYLDLEYLLNYAYVEKCGFDEVIHNLPNYRIPRADFSLNASFHSIATSFYALFRPIIFEDDNRLFIIDVFGEIPEGILSGARLINLNGYITYTNQEPEAQITNAVLLTHREISVQSLTEDEFPANVTQRQEYEEQNVGTPFTSGWQLTRFTRFIAEIHDDEDDPSKITSEVVWKVETRTSGYDENGTFRDLSIETQTDRYSNSWRLKLGYVKIVEAFVENGSGLSLMQTVMIETNVLVWKPSVRKPGEWEKNFSKTSVEGLVLVDGTGSDAILTPIMDASRNKEIPDDDSIPIEQRPISSQIEVWRYTGADQIEVHIQKLDQLTKRSSSTRTVEHVGTNAVRIRSGDSFNTKQVLLVDETSDTDNGPREPISFDAGYVPYTTAKELALRMLALSNAPLQTVSLTLPSFDGGIRRGSVRRVRDRDGNEINMIVTGYRVTGTQKRPGFLTISQSIEGFQLAP